MAALKEKHKRFIVKQLACYESPTNIIEQLKTKYGLKKVSASQLSYYNPDTESSRKLAPRWRHLFETTRDDYITDIGKVAIAQKVHRLQKLQEMYDLLFACGEYVEAAAILEQAAKETGGFYEKSKMDGVIQAGNSVNFYQQVNQRIIEMNKKELN